MAWVLTMGGAAYAQSVVPTAAPADAAVAAATAPANGVIAYPAAFFTGFRPTSAFDMVGRVPGFTYAGGDDVRGFAGAAGNVLIDGERPSSKSVSLDDALKRISPENVERLDLIRGGAAGIDMQGQPVVVNVVRRKAASRTLSVDGYSRIYHDVHPSATLRVEGSRRTENTTLEGAFLAQEQPGQAETGKGIVVRSNAAGANLVSGPLDVLGIPLQFQLNGAGEYRRANDTFRVTAGAFHQENVRNEDSDLRTAAGIAAPETAAITTSTDTAEVGGDYQRRLSAAVTARLVGLYTYGHAKAVTDQTGRGGRQVSDKDSTNGEAILRGSLTMLHSGGLTVETGGETAFNYLDNASSLTSSGVLVVLPSANVRVEERRSEGFLTASLKPTPRVSLEAAARVETSTISQSGDVTKERSFTFVKPRLVVAVAPRPSTQLRFRFERTVGQLKFEDFAASSDLTAGIISAGNANLEPERAWLTELTWEQRFWGRGALVLTATHRAIDQAIDLIPVFGPTGVFSAPGNIGDGRRDDFKASLTLPLDKLGARGGLVRFNATLRDSEVTDPVTGMPRPISLVRSFEGDFTYTQDIPAWNSTFTLESGNIGARDRSYRLAEIQTLVDMPLAKATWLYRPRPNLIMSIAVENLLSKERHRSRVLYAGTRASRTIASYDYRSTELKPWLSFRLRRTF